MAYEFNLEEQLTLIRPIRNQKLADSDWTQLADAPLTDAKKKEWATYRQGLRDVPSTLSGVKTQFEANKDTTTDNSETDGLIYPVPPS